MSRVFSHGLGHGQPSLSPVTSDCSRFVSGLSRVDQLMTVYGTPETTDLVCLTVGFLR